DEGRGLRGRNPPPDPGRAGGDRRRHRRRSAARLSRLLPAGGRSGARAAAPVPRAVRAALGDTSCRPPARPHAGRAQRRAVRRAPRPRRRAAPSRAGDLVPLPADPALPLADLKILDSSWVGVGPITVKYLADHGATVVRVESHVRLDVVRLGPPWHDAKPGIERTQFYASYNTSKYGLALDLGKPEARAIGRRLATWADVVVESFTPRVMRGWGLAYEDLCRLNPRLVMMSTCPQGQTGPHAEFPGYGQLMAALSGFYATAGWPDRDPPPPHGA